DPMSPSHASVALISGQGELIDWNDQFVAEFDRVKDHVRAGADFFALLAASAGADAAAAARDGFGEPRSYRYASGDRVITVDESRSAAGHIVRSAEWVPDSAWPIELQRTIEGATRGPDGVLALRRRAQEELLRARDAADAANNAKNRFVATVSHELRTPMQGILGMTSLLMHSEVDATKREYLVALDKSGRLLLDLINDILDVSRIEEGTLTVEESDVDLIETTEGVLALLAARAHDKRLDLRLRIDPKVPRSVRTDPLRFRQILLNLVGNSLKFTQQGSVNVEVRLVEGARLHVEVRDTGVGIHPDDQARLFQRFSQIGQPASTRHGGAGLGLSIAKDLVERMRGTIGFESAPGVGSTFWFEIPIAVDRPLEGRAGAPHDLTGYKVLLVEDNEINQAVVQAFLVRAGATCMVVGDGPSAIDACRNHRFDVILMDIHLPGMSGFVAARVIREQSMHGAAPKIIAISADNLRNVEARAAAVGIDACVAKPFSRERFIAAIIRVVDRPSAS
ncbi:MAG: ATP-binding protein, partial [Nannocystaceae bacterium]